jgi:hypothetical protein
MDVMQLVACVGISLITIGILCVEITSGIRRRIKRKLKNAESARGDR